MNSDKFFKALDERGERMLKVVCYALDLQLFSKKFWDISSDWKEMIEKETSILSDTNPEDWNAAIGFSHAWWGNGSNIQPTKSEADLMDAFSEKASVSYDDAYDIDFYDNQGRKIELYIKEMGQRLAYGSGETFDEFFSYEPERLAKEKEKKIKQEEKKAEKALLKKKAMEKLSTDERKVLGLK